MEACFCRDKKPCVFLKLKIKASVKVIQTVDK